MSGTAFNISMVLRTDVAAAKAGLADVSGGLRAVSTEAGKTSAVTQKQKADLEALAAAAAKAAQSQQDLVAAERRAQETRARGAAFVGPVANPATTAFMTGFRAAETAASSLRDAVGGLSVTIGSQAQDMLEASRANAVYRSALDDIRASFNPLFAASRQYEAQLDRIAEAERLGAISAREAADARQRAASIIAPAGMAGPQPAIGGYGNSAMNTGYFAAQANDVMMMAAMGQDPMMLALQQGPQISQQLNLMGGGMQAVKALGSGILSMLNPISLATIGIIGLGTAAVQWFASSREKAKTFDDALKDLSEGTDAYERAMARARASTADMAAEFGSAAGEAKGFLQVLSDIERRRVLRAADAAVSSAAKDIGLLLPTLSTVGPETASRSQDDKVREGRDQDLRRLRRQFGLDRSDESAALVESVYGSLTDLKAAKGADAQVRAAEAAQAAWLAAAEAKDGVSESEDAFLGDLGKLIDSLRQFQAIEENAAGKAKAKEMADDLERRAELERTILQYGAQSAAARAVENRQEREALQQRLDDLSITRDSLEGRRALAALAEVQAARDAALRDEQRQYLRDQDDRIANLRLEMSLIGASKAERTRLLALAEAETDIRDRNLGLLDGMLARLKAITAAEAENLLARKQALRDLQIQAVGDAYDVRIGLARDPVAKADLEFQKALNTAIADGRDPVVAYSEALQARSRAVADTIVAGRVQIADMADELQVRQGIAAQVAAGAINSAEANRLMREELELRPLIAAAARAEGAEKRQLLDVIAGLRLAREALAAEDRRQAQNDYLRGQAESIQQLRLELALVGETAATRARILALAKAEQDIRRLGFEGAAAEDVRRQAREQGDLARQIEAQADAWKRVQSAGESAIDGVLDKLKGGDIKGALEEFAGEIEKGFFDLAIRNPLKNALFGTNLGTLDDVGGLSGIWGKLTGKTALDEQGILDMAAAPVQSMTIAASNVILNAGALSGLPGLAANTNGMPALTGAGLPGSLTGSSDVQSQVWNFFSGKGLKPHQVAGIMGNVAGESGFNPMIPGDNGNAVGLFQHNGPRMRALLQAIGGKGNLGNVNSQLDFVWQELMGPERGAFDRLMASTDVRGATDAFMRGFERPAEWAMTDSWGTRLGAAEAALAKFGTTATTATTDLGALGNGMGVFGNALQGLVQGGPQGALSGLIGGLGQLAASALDIPGFATGGYHRGGLRIVGENGPELEATGPSRIFSAGETREILTSSAPVMAANSAAPIDTRPVIQIVNNSSAQVTGEVEETTDARGQRQHALVLSDMVATGLGKQGGQAARTMRNLYGTGPAVRRRGG